jgi:hypothetical protein
MFCFVLLRCGLAMASKPARGALPYATSSARALRHAGFTSWKSC